MTRCMNVADVMTPRSDVVTADIPGSRGDVLKYLQERRFSSVPVIKETDGSEEFRGLVSRESLIEQPDEDQLAMLIEEVPTVTAETSVGSVADVMVGKTARRVPVVDGRLEGIVTITDIVRAIATGEVDGETKVGELARRDVNCVYGETPLTVAERELFHADVPYGVVLDGHGTMDGMITEVDILDVARVVEGEEGTGDSIANEDDAWAWEGIKAVGNRYMPTRNVELPDGLVEEFMTPDLITVGERRTARDIARMMIENEIEQVPLVSGDELVGIVRDVDLLKGV